MTQFLEQIRAARPEIAAREKANAEKGRQAMELRRLRDAAALTQDELAAAAGIEGAEVRRLESLVGPLPSQAEVDRYRAACGRP
ncbi:helix-turn-helix domain-containing protein [Roseivivax marinus]|uniref:helix-turn-helix domain-containing protein n=1 Tax=Roseivivax marinus TaxID=1379903 RepID=UPI000B88AF4A|nr:helix-turn-helix domain-containing protein [Roseivivax marinus]